MDGYGIRNQHAIELIKHLRPFDSVRLPQHPDVSDGGVTISYYRFYFFLNRDRLAAGWDRSRILSEARDDGVPCGVGCCGEIYNEALFSDHPHRVADDMRHAKELSLTSIAVPVHPTLAPETVQAYGGYLR